MKINQYNKECQKDGYWEVCYRNGILWCKGNYNNDRQQGYWEYYHFDGNLSHKGNYDNGNRVGLWKEYNYDGELKLEIFYY